MGDGREMDGSSIYQSSIYGFNFDGCSVDGCNIYNCKDMGRGNARVREVDGYEEMDGIGIGVEWRD